MRIENQKDFATGGLYVVFGFSVAIMSLQYRLGTAGAMEPGYFPFWLGVLLTIIGGVVLFNSIRRKHSADSQNDLARWDLRILAIIVLSVVLFGIVLNYLGLFAAVIALVMTASLASHEFRLRTALLNSAVLVALTYVIFIYGIHLQIPIWPPMLGY